jgi:hypothetical protein
VTWARSYSRVANAPTNLQDTIADRWAGALGAARTPFAIVKSTDVMIARPGKALKRG